MSRTFKCAMCGVDIAWGALIAHIPQCYRQYCAELGMVPLCTCHTCEGRRTHPKAADSQGPPSSASSSARNRTGKVKRALAEENDEGTDTTGGAHPSKRPRVQSEDEEEPEAAATSADNSAVATLNLLNLPDLVLFELCQWLDWDLALALAATSRTARDTVLAYHHVVRVMLLEVLPLVTSAVASVSLQPRAALAHCDDHIDREDLCAALSLPAETQPDGPAVEAGNQLDLATKAEVLLDALTQVVSTRRQQVFVERTHWKDLYASDQACSAIERVIRENIVVRSYAKQVVASDEAITCILAVKVPRHADFAERGHDVFILNLMYWQLGLPTNEYGQRKDHIVRTQAFCRRAGETTKTSLLFGYHEECSKVYYGNGRHHQLDRNLLTRFAQALRLPLDAQQAETGHYREDLHLFTEKPLLAPPIRLDLNHPSCSWGFLRRLSRWIKAKRFQLKLPRAYIVAALRKPECVVTVSDVERVLPHILRGTGKCSRMQIIEASVECRALVHLAVPGEEGHLVLSAMLCSQEGWVADQSLIELTARASTESLGKRFGLGTQEDRCSWSLICAGLAKAGRDIVWQPHFLDEVARTYGLPAIRSYTTSSTAESEEQLEAARQDAIRIAATLYVCALAATPQYDVIKEGAATLRLGVDGPSVPLGFRMLPFGHSFLNVPVVESVADGLHSRYTAVVYGLAQTFGVLAKPRTDDDYSDEDYDDDFEDFDDEDDEEDDDLDEEQ